ncbi:MAG: chloride channel protein [Lachnospiraceae bacterium]|nr:chloride channel protein [Lachnospiraceae bacterium]
MNDKTEVFYDEIEKQSKRLLGFLKWVLIAGIIGAALGLVGMAFYYGLQFVTDFRNANPLIILGLPIGGLAIIFLYHISNRDDDHGTNSVIAAVRSEEKLRFRTAPLIFVSSLITHLFGGSAGREGAALQMGGSIGNGIGKWFRLNEKDMHVAVMCGMSACFAAVFGTPIAATFFAMEVVSVGIMYYSALVPCVFSSLIAIEIAKLFGVKSESFSIVSVPNFSAESVSKIVLVSILCAALSILFCVSMHAASKYTKKWVPNAYLRIFLFGILIVIIQFLTGTTDYMGAGMDVIERAIDGEVNGEAVLLKLVLTAITLGVGFKGGEIVPSFFVGATFGCLLGHALGISPSMCAAIGMIAVFCGVTNSPVTSVLLGFELFGMDGINFILIGVAVSYMLSGYYSLYNSQKIMYSKFDAEYRGNIWNK